MKEYSREDIYVFLTSAYFPNADKMLLNFNEVVANIDEHSKYHRTRLLHLVPSLLFRPINQVNFEYLESRDLKIILKIAHDERSIRGYDIRKSYFVNPYYIESANNVDRFRLTMKTITDKHIGNRLQELF